MEFFIFHLILICFGFIKNIPCHFIQPLKCYLKKTSVGEDLEKLEYLYTVGKDIKWCSYYGKQYSGFSKN